MKFLIMRIEYTRRVASRRVASRRVASRLIFTKLSDLQLLFNYFQVLLVDGQESWYLAILKKPMYSVVFCISTW
jgi:hypothetical protein